MTCELLPHLEPGYRPADDDALMAEGRSNSAIEASLVVTQRAVEKHISGTSLKLGLPATDADHRQRGAALPRSVQRAWEGVAGAASLAAGRGSDRRRRPARPRPGRRRIAGTGSRHRAANGRAWPSPARSTPMLYDAIGRGLILGPAVELPGGAGEQPVATMPYTLDRELLIGEKPVLDKALLARPRAETSGAGEEYPLSRLWGCGHLRRAWCRHVLTLTREPIRPQDSQPRTASPPQTQVSRRSRSVSRATARSAQASSATCTL